MNMEFRYLYENLDCVSGVYMIKNKQKLYIGYASSIRARIRGHLHDLIHNKHNNKLLQQDWNNDSSSFRCYLVEQTDNRAREAYWTIHFKSTQTGYNINIGTKLSQNQINNIASIHKGKTVSQETRQKLSEFNKGKKLSLETRMKMGESRTGRVSPMKGKHHSLEARKRISESNIGHPATSGMNGKHHSFESRQKISNALKQHNQNK